MCLRNVIGTAICVCMFRFFLKKSLYDGWDSMLILAAFNAGLLVVAAIGILIPARFDAPAIRIVGLVFLCLAFGVWSSTAAFSFRRIADFESCSFADVLEAFRNGLVSGLQFGAMMTLIIATAIVSLPFYASMGGTMGWFFAGLLFWILATIALTLQYFLPIRAITGARFIESIRLAFFMMMDAPSCRRTGAGWNRVPAVVGRGRLPASGLRRSHACRDRGCQAQVVQV